MTGQQTKPIRGALITRKAGLSRVFRTRQVETLMDDRVRVPVLAQVKWNVRDLVHQHLFLFLSHN